MRSEWEKSFTEEGRMRSFWRQSILVRAVAQVVGVGLVVGLCFVLLTTWLTERYSRQITSQRICDLMTTVERTVQAACFTLDEALAQEVVDGLARNSEVFGATIVGGRDVLARRQKDDADDARQARAAVGRVSQAIVSPFDATRIVGELFIDPDPEIVRLRVWERSGFVALMLGLQLLAVVSAVAVVVLLWIVRPIKRMSDKLHGMDAHSIEALALPDGHEDTEIGRLVTDINALGERLMDSLAEEHHLRVLQEIGERKYHAIFENADSGIFVIDRDRALESCNQAFFRQLDLPSLAPGEKLDLLQLCWRDAAALARLIERCAAENRTVSSDFEYVAGNEDVRWFNVAVTPVGNQFIQGELSDISRHKQKELLAQRDAVTDAVTGLLNRAGFLQRIDEEIVACARDDGAGFTLLVVDLDGFQRANESLGLTSGDRILSITARRLRSCVKSSDTISRLGNDSFGIILRAVVDEKAVANIVTRVCAVLKSFFEVGSTPLQLGASIGITLFPRDGGDREALLRNAEMALGHAQAGGNARYRFFDIDMVRNAEYRRRLENDLRFAVQRNELAVHFQPIVNLSACRVVGAEALIRWQHKKYGLIPPDVFIPLAEETGAITAIGLWVVETACRQLADWKKRDIDRYISINVSVRQIPDGLPPTTLIETVNRYGVAPADLAIEITESVFMGNSEAAQNWLDAVHELGFSIYLDDFGTGYSSLSYIKRFPVDVLKVDKSFVRDMNDDDDNDRALVVAIIDMARSLRLRVVAEGVESQSQRDSLAAAGCHYVQGYYFSRPVAAGEIDAVARRIEALF
jgi:diguanylate cyclase (GGDEF)-like protein